MSKFGIICNVERERYFILTDRGDFMMKPGKPPAGKGLGDRVRLPGADRTWLRGLTAVAALALVLISSLQLFPLGSGDVNFRLTLDINPSIELSFNDDYHLTEWIAFNQAGEELLAELEKPDDVFVALAAIFSRCVELGLAQDQHDIFITTAEETPLDPELLEGAFAGHGAAVKVHVVKLPQAEYQSESGSPLRGYLKRKAGVEVKDSAPVADTALNYLSPELISTVQVMPWYSNPVVQAFVEKYLINGDLVEEMLVAGLDSDQVASLLELAKTEKLTPADLFAELKASGLTPGQFFQQHKTPGKVHGPDLVAPDWLPELLAQEFDCPAGQISSLLRKGTESEDLQASLILERLGAGKLQKLVSRLKIVSLETLVSETGVDREQFAGQMETVDNLIRTAVLWNEDDSVPKLAEELKVSKGEILYILGRGYTLAETREIVLSKTTGKYTFKQIIDGLESGGPGMEDKIPKNNPGKGNQGKPKDEKPDKGK